MRSERDIFPTLFLFSHYVELSLKSLLLKKRVPHCNNHDLKFIFERVKLAYPKLTFNNEFLNFINFIDKTDKKAQCFRYPFDTNGNEFFKKKAKDISKGVYLSYVCAIINQAFSEFDNALKKPKKNLKLNENFLYKRFSNNSNFENLR